MRIQTGQGTIPLITLIGIWSISALNALPGLAVSPILGRLSAIFPHSTELDIQMLSSLPSLLIIPFIILSGKLTGVLLVERHPVHAFHKNVATDNSQRIIGDRFRIDRAAFHRFDFPLFYRNIPYETVRAQFRHYEYNVSAGHRSDGVSGRGELAFAVCRLPVSADLDRSLVLSEKEYFTVSRYRYKHH